MNQIRVPLSDALNAEMLKEAFEAYKASHENPSDALRHIIATPIEDEIIISYSSPNELFAFGFTCGYASFVAIITEEEE